MKLAALLRLHLVLWPVGPDRLALMTQGLGPDTIDFRFRFSAESPALLSVAHTVSAECVSSLSAYFRFGPKVKLPLSVDL